MTFLVGCHICQGIPNSNPKLLAIQTRAHYQIKYTNYTKLHIKNYCGVPIFKSTVLFWETNKRRRRPARSSPRDLLLGKCPGAFGFGTIRRLTRKWASGALKKKNGQVAVSLVPVPWNGCQLQEVSSSFLTPLSLGCSIYVLIFLFSKKILYLSD